MSKYGNLRKKILKYGDFVQNFPKKILEVIQTPFFYNIVGRQVMKIFHKRKH
jgi:hypothetical protein